MTGMLGHGFAEFLDRTPVAGHGQMFEAVKQKMLSFLRDMVLLDSEAPLDYLSPLFHDPTALTIATLNYDNAVELAAERNGWQWKDGLDEWRTGRPLLPEDRQARTVYLLKLHGSILWHKPIPHSNVPPWPGMKDRGGLASSAPQSTSSSPFRLVEFERVDGTSLKKPHSEYQPGVIFGGNNKITHEGPFLDLLRSFQQALDNSRILTVVGYSFRDAHINVPIARWLNQGIDRVLRVVDPNFSSLREPFLTELSMFGQANPARLVLKTMPYGLSDAEYDARVRTFTGDALTDLYGISSVPLSTLSVRALGF